MEKAEAVRRFKELLLDFPSLVKLVYRLLRDPRVSAGDKAALGAVVVYVLNPVDLIPDFLPVVGQIDDAYLVAVALLRLLGRADENVLREHWEGDSEIVPLLQAIVDTAAFYLPASVRRLLLGIPKREASPPSAEEGPVTLD